MRLLLAVTVFVALLGQAHAADSPGRDALSVLRTLRTMATDRPTYAEYIGRLYSAKSRIDILLTKVTDRAVSAAISMSKEMGCIDRDCRSISQIVPGSTRVPPLRIDRLRQPCD